MDKGLKLRTEWIVVKRLVPLWFVCLLAVSSPAQAAPEYWSRDGGAWGPVGTANPAAHAASHESGGGDALTGTLAVSSITASPSASAENSGALVISTHVVITNGRLGIGTARPASKLSVNGDLRLGNESVACTAANEGALRYNSTSKKMEFCNATAWAEIGGGGVPADTVAYFNGTSCPTGWTELTTARGRYLVGLPSGGTLGGTAGTALTDQEDRRVGQHNHGISDPGHGHNVQRLISGENPGGALLVMTSPDQDTTNPQYIGTTSAGTGVTVLNTGSVADTNAPYLQLLVCEKD